MQINTRKRPDGKSREPGENAWHCLWYATITGPWYGDSDPEGYGDTEEEAIQDALDSLRDLHELVGTFLKQHEDRLIDPHSPKPVEIPLT